MSTVRDAAQRVLAALQGVDGVRVYDSPGAVIDPPGVVLMPPSLSWSGICSGPTGAQFSVYVVVVAGKRALEELWDLVPPVADALDDTADVTVHRATPGLYLSGSELPCYEIEIEVSL